LQTLINNGEQRMPKVLVPLAQGCEELEAVTIIDLLRRAGIEVVTAGLDDQPVKASRGVVFIPDTILDNIINELFDMIILPGGLPGSDYLNEDQRILNLLKKTTAQGKYVAAICAAPKVLATAGLLQHKKATSYPTVLESLQLPNTNCTTEAVVKDGLVITSRGPGTAMDFALELIETLCGKEKKEQVERALVR
jgi:protein deglycase